MRVASKVQPSVILCDIGLPVMDGYRVAQAIRSAPALATSMMIALTGYGEVTANALATQASRIMSIMPADPAMVAELVARAAEAA